MKILNKVDRNLWREVVAESNSLKGAVWSDGRMDMALNTIDHFEASANEAIALLKDVEDELQELRDDIAQPAEDLDYPSWLDDKQLVNPLSDSVQSPTHYDLGGGVEVIDVIKNRTREMSGHRAYLAGNAIKYLLRFPFKDAPVEDLKKCRYHIDALIELLGPKK